MINKVLKKREKMLGLVALFKDPYHLYKAANEVRVRNFIHCDAFTPYPMHGLDKLLNHKRSPVPWVTLIFGLSGCLGGFLLEYWTSVISWPLNVGGKPFNSFPAFVPIMFECSILVGGLATLVALLVLCRLPNFHTNVLDKALTDNSFAIYIPAKEKGFSEADVRSFLEKSGAYEIKKVE